MEISAKIQIDSHFQKSFGRMPAEPNSVWGQQNPPQATPSERLDNILISLSETVYMIHSSTPPQLRNIPANPK